MQFGATGAHFVMGQCELHFFLPVILQKITSIIACKYPRYGAGSMARRDALQHGRKPMLRQDESYGCIPSGTKNQTRVARKDLMPEGVSSIPP